MRRWAIFQERSHFAAGRRGRHPRYNQEELEEAIQIYLENPKCLERKDGNTLTCSANIKVVLPINSSIRWRKFYSV